MTKTTSTNGIGTSITAVLALLALALVAAVVQTHADDAPATTVLPRVDRAGNTVLYAYWDEPRGDTFEADIIIRWRIGAGQEVVEYPPVRVFNNSSTSGQFTLPWVWYRDAEGEHPASVTIDSSLGGPKTECAIFVNGAMVAHHKGDEISICRFSP